MTPKPRKFADLRPHPLARPIENEEPIEKVVMRLFSSSADGLRVLGWMLTETGKCAVQNAPECALRENEGARRFVALIHQITQGSYVPSSS